MFAKPQFKNCEFLQIFLFLPIGLVLLSCTTRQNKTEILFTQVTETSSPTEISHTPLTPTSTVKVDATPTPSATKAITIPTLINIEVPLETENLPAYGWFAEDDQVVHFAYPEEGVIFSYNIATQQLVSTTLSQKSDEQIIEQITVNLPVNARVWEVSPRYQNVLYTVPISQPITLERGAFTVPLDNELWLYKDGESAKLGAVDSCFLINLPRGASWSPSETLVTVNAFAAMACAWSNWLIDLETSSVFPLDETWEEGASGFSVAAILPNKQLLLTALLQDEPSAVLDLQTQELTVFSNRGNEIAKYMNEVVLLDFIFWPSSDRTEDKTEIGFSPLYETNWQLIDTIEGWVRAKYVSPNQKHVLLFCGSPYYYGLSEHHKTSGIWLLAFP